MRGKSERESEVKYAHAPRVLCTQSAEIVGAHIREGKTCINIEFAQVLL